MTETIECAVIGAGVIGLAVARAQALAGREVVVLESEDAIGTATSSRNSEVIHAGIYYPAGSLKARLCVSGLKMLYAYLETHGIDFQRCGKLIVATDDDETALLRALMDKGLENGVAVLEWMEGAAVRKLEPALNCESAIWSPSTGIFDSHAYMLSLQGEIESNGGAIAFVAPVTGGRVSDGGTILNVGGDAPMEVLAKTAINCAGHGAQPVAASLAGFPPAAIPPQHFAKGNYFYLAGRAPFERLIYPVPGAASLGMHYTRDLGGQGRFGPDVEWVDGVDYEVDPARAEGFALAIERYWPEIRDRELTPGYAGVRPKIQAPGEAAHDFVIQGPADHGQAGLVNLYGIESPGLTASLAIAEHVTDMLS